MDTEEIDSLLVKARVRAICFAAIVDVDAEKIAGKISLEDYQNALTRIREYAMTSGLSESTIRSAYELAHACQGKWTLIQEPRTMLRHARILFQIGGRY